MEHGRATVGYPRTKAGRLVRPVKGVSNMTPEGGEPIVGSIPANGAR